MFGTLTVVLDCRRLPDGADQVTFRGAFRGDVPAELGGDPPAGVARQSFAVPADFAVDVPVFRLVTRHLPERPRHAPSPLLQAVRAAAEARRPAEPGEDVT